MGELIFAFGDSSSWAILTRLVQGPLLVVPPSRFWNTVGPAAAFALLCAVLSIAFFQLKQQTSRHRSPLPPWREHQSSPWEGGGSMCVTKVGGMWKPAMKMHYCHGRALWRIGSRRQRPFNLSVRPLLPLGAREFCTSVNGSLTMYHNHISLLVP